MEIVPELPEDPYWEDDDFERKPLEDPRQDALHSNPELREAFAEGKDKGLDYDEAMDYAYEKLGLSCDALDEDRNSATPDRTEEPESTTIQIRKLSGPSESDLLAEWEDGEFTYAVDNAHFVNEERVQDMSADELFEHFDGPYTFAVEVDGDRDDAAEKPSEDSSQTVLGSSNDDAEEVE